LIFLLLFSFFSFFFFFLHSRSSLGGSLVALLLQRRPLPISLLRRVTGMAALSQDIEKNSFMIGQVLLEVMAAAAKGSADGAVSGRDADSVFEMLLRAGLDLDAVTGEESKIPIDDVIMTHPLS
jgi:hypothetical protein